MNESGMKESQKRRGAANIWLASLLIFKYQEVRTLCLEKRIREKTKNKNQRWTTIMNKNVNAKSFFLFSLVDVSILEIR